VRGAQAPGELIGLYGRCVYSEYTESEWCGAASIATRRVGGTVSFMIERIGSSVGVAVAALAVASCLSVDSESVETRAQAPADVVDGGSPAPRSDASNSDDETPSEPSQAAPSSSAETPAQKPGPSPPDMSTTSEPSVSLGFGGAGGGVTVGSAGAGGGGGNAAGGGPTSGGAGAMPSGLAADTPTRLDPVPPPNSSWEFPLADIYSVTLPVLAPIDGGVVIAGGSGDPATVGLDALDEGIVAEAFVARLDYDGKVRWTVPLLDAGAPRKVAVNAAGEVVVIAPYMPGFESFSSYSSWDDLYLVKLNAEGDVLYEQVLTYDLGQDGTTVYGMDVADDGSVYIAGLYAVDGQHPLLAKYDTDGSELWVAPVDHTGVQGWANDAVALPNGDVVFTGYFDATANFGGDTIESRGTSGSMTSVLPNGFIVRLTASGQHVYSERFGGTSVDGGTALARLGDATILTGGLTGETSVGGKVALASEEGSSFVSSLSATGAAGWVTVGPGLIGRAVATDLAGNVYLGGQLGGDRIVASFSSDGTPLVEATVGGGGSVNSYALAVDDNFGVWVAGTFSGDVDFGNGNVLNTDEQSVFLVRLQRLPIE